MQRKKLKLLLASLAASTILFAVPISVAATDTPSSGNTSEDKEEAPSGSNVTDLSTLTKALTLPKADDPCPKGCIHVFTGTSPYTVKVSSGDHTIYLRGNVNIAAKDDSPAFEVSGTAKVTLALETGCDAEFDGGNTAWAGLEVSEKAQLTIRGKGNLSATGGEGGGAGICVIRLTKL